MPPTSTPAPAEITVTTASGNDLGALRQLVLRAYAEHLSAVDAHFAEAFGRELDDQIQDPRGHLLVARLGDNSVGCTLMRLGHQGEYPWPSDSASIHLLAVLPEVRGRGIGRLLVERGIGVAEKAGRTRVALHTAESMRPARTLYETLGFMRRPRWDEHPEGAPAALAYEWTAPTPR